MMTSTSARPGTLLWASGCCKKKKDALCWGDTELFIVIDPERPNCKVLLMRVRHRLNKGKRNKGRATSSSLPLKMTPSAATGSKKPKISDVPAHRKSVPIHFKKEMERIPIFQSTTRDKEGNWITHPTEPLTYTQFCEDERRLDRAWGAADNGSPYKYRKSNAAAIADAMIRLSTNSSITRDPSAPRGLTPAQRRSVEGGPNLMALERDCIEFRDALITEYGTLSKIKDMTILQDYRQRCNKRGGLSIQPWHLLILPKRKALVAIEFQNRDVNTVPDEELMEDRIKSLDLRLTLSRLTIPRHLASRPKALAEDILSNDKWSPSGLECPLCLNHDSFHPQVQQFSYCNKYVLRRHKEKTHLQHMDFSKAIRCSYLDCGKLLTSAEQSSAISQLRMGLSCQWGGATLDYNNALQLLE
ncbi:hypothetical protein BDDG_02102 [Blastomyces dermatitidis ATCC 18188]|nr:hypothetical protein BDDG_02102 [Blastomyces dermatitidis ATCC 18188]